MSITYKITERPWGIECQFCCQRDGKPDINDIVMLGSVDIDPLPLIEARVAQQDQTVGPEPPQEPPSILTTIEADKERLKWVAVAAIRANPTVTAPEFLSTLTWNEAGIVQALIASYAQMAAQQGLVPGVPPDMSGCWSVLVDIITSLTDEQLRGML